MANVNVALAPETGRGWGVTRAEGPAARKVFLLVAWAAFLGYAYFLLSYCAPGLSRPGIDENAYLLAGRSIVEHGSAGFKPTDEFQFVGAMWVRTEDGVFPPPRWVPSAFREALTARVEAGWYYAKYPSGVGLLDAAFLWLLGGAHSLYAAEAAFLLAPMGTALGVFGMFFLGRRVTGSSFLGLMGMLMLGCGQTTLDFSLVAGSHGPDLAFVAWGMLMLLRWWQGARGGMWNGVAAGFILGYAVTLRYTEALLLFPLNPLTQVLEDTSLKANHPHVWSVLSALKVLPIGPLGMAAITMWRPRKLGTWATSALPILAWCVPVGCLVAFNWFTLGHATGYDTTHESTGFTTAEFVKKWQFSLYQVTTYGTLFLAPLGFVGLGAMFRQSWRLGWFCAMWFLPGALLYVAYYWGQGMPGTAYLRFYLSLYPPLILGALWLVSAAMRGASARRGSIGMPVAVGAVVAISTSISLANGLPYLERQHRGNMNLAYSCEALARAAKLDGDKYPAVRTMPRPVIFADEGIFPQFVQQGQFVFGADWYATDAFEPRAGGGFGMFGAMQGNRNDPNAPLLFQKARVEHADEVRKGKGEHDLRKEMFRITDAALAAGRPVFAMLMPQEEQQFRSRYVKDHYELVKLDRWREPCNTSGFPGAEFPDGPFATSHVNGEPIIRWAPATFTLYRLERLAPTTRASSGPATRR